MQNSSKVGGFGFGQIHLPTPQGIKNARKALNFFSGGVVVFLPAIAGWIHTTTDNLTTIMGIFILGFNSLSALFGVPPEDDK